MVQGQSEIVLVQLDLVAAPAFGPERACRSNLVIAESNLTGTSYNMCTYMFTCMYMYIYMYTHRNMYMDMA